jgi:signal transduction histidine kinase
LKFEQYYKQVNKYLYDGEKLDSGLYWANRMIKEAQTSYQKGLGNFAKGHLMNSIDWDYNKGEFSLPYFVKAVNFFDPIKNRENIHIALNELAECYNHKYNPNNEKSSAKGMLYTSMALKLQHDSTFRITLPFTANFDDRSATRKELIEAIKVMKENLAFWEKQGSLPHQMWRNHSLSNQLWYLTKNFKLFEAYEKKALALAENLSEQMFISIYLGTLAVFGNQSKEYKKALAYGEEGLAHALKYHKENTVREAIFRDQLYISNKAFGRMEEAFRHKERALQIAEKAYRESESKKMMFMRELNHELQKRVKIEEQLVQQQKQQKWYGFGITLLLLLLGYIFFNNSQLKKKNKEISEAMLKGQATERKRVASDLHDTLGSTLSSIQWSLQAIDSSKMSTIEQKVYQNLTQMLENAYNQVRLLSHNLLPEDLEKQGLKAALEGFVRKINKNTPLQFRLLFSENFPRLPPKTEFELYSICLELINNIMKHADASKAAIEFNVKGTQLSLIVTDNGHGIKQNHTKGRGLSNVAERTQSLNGTWVVQSSQEEGTENSIELPI